MLTEVLLADAAAIAQAAAILRGGGLVAFLTETVYGLGANALDVQAVAGVFAAKGRPSHNPLIVHVADLAEAKRLADDWPRPAQRLAERFWPGPRHRRWLDRGVARSGPSGGPGAIAGDGVAGGGPERQSVVRIVAYTGGTRAGRLGGTHPAGA
jgi:hypothetical protein